MFSDFKDEHELLAYLKSQYDATLNDPDKCLNLCAQSIILVTLHFLKETQNDKPEVNNNRNVVKDWWRSYDI